MAMAMNANLSLATRFWLFLYGYPNIAGSVLGLAGLAFLFAGIIGPGWGYIVAGLYGLGWLLAWQVAPAEAHLQIARGIHAGTLLAELDQLVAKVAKRLPREAFASLTALRDTLGELLPKLVNSPVFSHEAHSVEKTVRDYLPATLENYLRLPPVFARMHKLTGGKTADVLLQEQLDLLHEQMRNMLQGALADDARALAENGAFLRDRFTPYDFFQPASRT
jgi:hypothetical protein